MIILSPGVAAALLVAVAALLTGVLLALPAAAQPADLDCTTSAEIAPGASAGTRNIPVFASGDCGVPGDYELHFPGGTVAAGRTTDGRFGERHFVMTCGGNVTVGIRFVSDDGQAFNGGAGVNVPAQGCDYMLQRGVTFLTWTGGVVDPVAAFGGGVPEELQVIWEWNQTNQQWLRWVPDLPDSLQRFHLLVPGNVYAVVLDDPGIEMPWFIAGGAGGGPCGPNPDPPDAGDPRVVVDQPAPDVTIDNPVSISGQAAVFEAVVSIRILDADGTVLADTTTMTAEGQTMSLYAENVAYDTPSTNRGCIEVFEASARDGSPTNVVQVPVRFSFPG